MKSDILRIDRDKDLEKIKIKTLAKALKSDEGRTSFEIEMKMIGEAGDFFKKSYNDGAIEKSFVEFLRKNNQDNGTMLVLDIIIYGAQRIASGQSFRNQKLGELLDEFADEINVLVPAEKIEVS